MKTRHKTVNDAVLAFLREELDRRYGYENICRFKDLKGIAPETVAEFRDFTLRRVYPEGEARETIDEAFDGLHELLRSPRKMASLGKVAMSAVWRLGRRLPVAVSAGQQVIEAFACASAVETLLCKAVLHLGLSWRSGLETEAMKDVFAQCPAEPFEALINALTRLLELAANTDTMLTGLGLLADIAETMSLGGEQWTDVDRQGVALAMDTLQEVLALFSRIDNREVPRFIRGIEAVERDWYQTLCAGK